jgi:hypothetical protein
MDNSSITSLIVPTIGILASVITASLSYYFAKVQQIRSENRKLKEDFYRAFIKAISDTAIDNEDEAARQKLAESFNTLTLVASREVVDKLMSFHEVTKSTFGTEMKLQEYLQEHDKRLRDLIIEMRRDLFGNKSNEKGFPNIHLVGMGKKSSRE